MMLWGEISGSHFNKYECDFSGMSHHVVWSILTHILMMQAVGSSETLLSIYLSTWCYILEDSYFQMMGLSFTKMKRRMKDIYCRWIQREEDMPTNGCCCYVEIQSIILCIQVSVEI
jgi:hypothetical protein